MMLRSRKFMAAGVLMVGLMLVAAFAHCASTDISGPKTYSDEELGIRKEPLSDEQTTYPAHGEPLKQEPGASTRFERSFENSPPLIPHDITGMLPLAQKGNVCLDCHMPAEAVTMGATPLPKSHFVDMDTGKDLDGKLDGDRFNCMQCHVIQTAISPPVANYFRGEFRDVEGHFRSNLMQILNEGVSAD
ncbi:MAG: nitrate reductase cytochrome c-type subunit [Nitrospiraceae bacterium]|nr:MAG: nitrate reductase cytochrome c-type subunit [Nitrospiraceae bacterium]